ncbi:MAG: HAMP domain-containing histidine kinase, partial [Bacteroidales bacterium]|nr:HAMP domain-containing histidine kinase [Bacteroidales bacterium]
FKSEEFIKYEELFHILEISTQRLEDFLLLAERITAFKAKRYHLQPYSFSIKELVHKTVAALAGKSLEKNIAFEYDLQSGSDCFADKELIEVCIKEVIDNAIKYSCQNSKIIIKTFCQGKNHVLEVIDQGRGFPEIVLKHKYKTFITSGEYSEQGTGLDLALIQLIMEAHNGKLEIDNNTDGGALVRLVF